MVTLNLPLPKMHGLEVSPGVYLIGEPSPVTGTNKLRCLADVGGMLCLVELSMKFGEVVADLEAVNG